MAVCWALVYFIAPEPVVRPDCSSRLAALSAVRPDDLPLFAHPLDPPRPNRRSLLRAWTAGAQPAAPKADRVALRWIDEPAPIPRAAAVRDVQCSLVLRRRASRGLPRRCYGTVLASAIERLSHGAGGTHGAPGGIPSRADPTQPIAGRTPSRLSTLRVFQTLIRWEWPMRLLNPLLGDFNPFLPEFRVDPYPFYRRLQAKHRVYTQPLARRHLSAAALRRHRRRARPMRVSRSIARRPTSSNACSRSAGSARSSSTRSRARC